jgi:flagellin
MADKVNLTASVRTNLLSLVRTSSLIDRTSNRLSTGLKVNSALDDPGAFFAARSLSFRANDLLSIKDTVDQSVSALKTALAGLDAITDLIQQAKALANSAKATGDTNERSTLAVQFNALLDQVDFLANDTSFSGANLIQATPDNLEVTFNEDATSNLTVSGIDSTTASTGINVADAASAWANDTVVNTALTAVNAALSTLRTSAATLGSSNTILQSRLDFTSELVNSLQEGAGKLTLADLNEESANLLALQTAQQLGLNSLSLAAQSERSVLSLFG